MLLTAEYNTLGTEITTCNIMFLYDLATVLLVRVLTLSKSANLHDNEDRKAFQQIRTHIKI